MDAFFFFFFFYVCGFRIPSSSSMKWRIYVGTDGTGFTCIG